jgi:hypothetical protein
VINERFELEDRDVTIGETSFVQIMVVVHAERGDRIASSARRADALRKNEI